MESAELRRITLRAIAEKANVSRMTVSRALRSDRSIPQVTAKRIQRIARELGYRPDPNVVRLLDTIRGSRRSEAPSVIAYLTAYDDPADWRRHPVRPRFFEAASRRAIECGYRLEEFNAREPGMNDERLTQIMHHRGIDGMIVAPLPQPQACFQRLKWQHFSVVEIGYSLSRPELHRVCNHQFQSITLLLRKLHESGYRRVGLAMNLEQDNRVFHHWRAGHLASLHREGCRNAAALAFLPPQWDRSGFLRWLRRARPDAIVTIGPQVHAWLAEAGVRVPEDLGLANVDLRPDMPGVTGIDQNSHMVGAAAVDLVISLIRQNERGIPAAPRVLMVHGRFVAGETTRRQTRRSPGGGRSAR